jgi:hypothetical protein
MMLFTAPLNFTPGTATITPHRISYALRALCPHQVMRNFTGPGGPLPPVEVRRAKRPGFLENHCRLQLVDLHQREGELRLATADVAVCVNLSFCLSFCLIQSMNHCN